MEQIKKGIQMLYAIKLKKGFAKTSEIAKIMRTKPKNVRDIGRNLINRRLVRKKVEINRVRGGYNQTIWSFNPKSFEKIERLLKEAYGDDYED